MLLFSETPGKSQHGRVLGPKALTLSQKTYQASHQIVNWLMDTWASPCIQGLARKKRVTIMIEKTDLDHHQEVGLLLHNATLLGTKDSVTQL